MAGIIVTDTTIMAADAIMADTTTIVTTDITGAGDTMLFPDVMDTIQAGAITIDIEVQLTEAITEAIIIIGDIEEAIPDPVIADPDMADIRNSFLAA